MADLRNLSAKAHSVILVTSIFALWGAGFAFLCDPDTSPRDCQNFDNKTKRIASWFFGGMAAGAAVSIGANLLFP